MLDSPRHRRILVLLPLAFGLSSWFWADPRLDWTRRYKEDAQTLAALIGLPPSAPPSASLSVAFRERGATCVEVGVQGPNAPTPRSLKRHCIPR